MLLFKARFGRRHGQQKDETDFRYTLPLLTDQQRGWLATMLSLVHPDHPWITRLTR